jgi:hypothetical protein
MSAFRKALVLITTVLFTFIGGYSVLASDGGDDNNILIDGLTEKEVREELIEFGIHEKDVPHLIQKIKDGEQWDSMNEEKINAVPSEKISATLDNPIVEYRFEDGSLYKSSIEPTELSILSCGSGYCNYNNYKVSESNWGISVSFRANFSIVKNGADRISSVRDKFVRVVGGTYDDAVLKIDRKKEQYGNSARASLTFKVTGIRGWISSTCYLRLYVGNDTFYTTRKM